MVLTTYTIYKLYKDGCNDFYIGSTFDFKRRQGDHKYNCTNTDSKKYNIPVYQFIRSNGGYDSWNYEILQQFDNDLKVKDELHYIERAYIELLNPTLNCCIPMRTNEEYKQNKKEYDKQYRGNNKEAIKEYLKQYRGNNKEAIKEYLKQYREDNKESIKQYKNQKFNCTCGGKYIRANKVRHMKSKKHQNFINQ